MCLKHTIALRVTEYAAISAFGRTDSGERV